MHLETVGLGEQLATGVTLVLSDACVLRDVSFKTRGMGERSVTVFTLVWFFASVSPAVLFKGT